MRLARIVDGAAPQLTAPAHTAITARSSPAPQSWCIARYPPRADAGVRAAARLLLPVRRVPRQSAADGHAPRHPRVHPAAPGARRAHCLGAVQEARGDPRRQPRRWRGEGWRRAHRGAAPPAGVRRGPRYTSRGSAVRGAPRRHGERVLRRPLCAHAAGAHARGARGWTAHRGPLAGAHAICRASPDAGPARSLLAVGAGCPTALCGVMFDRVGAGLRDTIIVLYVDCSLLCCISRVFCSRVPILVNCTV
ncbi:hypothetical protein GGX14DRAFT_594635, partial [Mycena pura]